MRRRMAVLIRAENCAVGVRPGSYVKLVARVLERMQKRGDLALPLPPTHTHTEKATPPQTTRVATVIS